MVLKKAQEKSLTIIADYAYIATVRTKLPTIPSKEINHAEAGRIIRQRREKSGMSLRRLAKEMGYSAPFVSDLELGRRNWTEETFNNAIKILSK